MAVPAAPTPLYSYQDEPTFMILRWEAPLPVLTEEGGELPITRYRIFCEGEDVADVYVAGSITGYKVRGLQQTRVYQFSVAAENANGYGPAAIFPACQPGWHKYGCP